MQQLTYYQEVYDAIHKQWILYSLGSTVSALALPYAHF